MLRWRWLELMCGAPPDTEKSTWGNTSDCWSGRGRRKVRKGGGAAMYLSACVRVGRGGAETAMLSYVGGGRAVGTTDWEVLMVILMGHAVTCCPGGGPVLSRCLSPCSPGHGLTVRVTEYSLKKCRPLFAIAPFLSQLALPKSRLWTLCPLSVAFPRSRSVHGLRRWPRAAVTHSHIGPGGDTRRVCASRVRAPDPPQNPGSSLAPPWVTAWRASSCCSQFKEM